MNEEFNPEEWEKMIAEAVAVKYIIVRLGGMATKSLVEDVMFSRYLLPSRHLFHEITNEIERRNVNVVRGWPGGYGPEPKFSDNTDAVLAAFMSDIRVQRALGKDNYEQALALVSLNHGLLMTDVGWERVVSYVVPEYQSEIRERALAVWGPHMVSHHQPLEEE